MDSVEHRHVLRQVAEQAQCVGCNDEPLERNDGYSNADATPQGEEGGSR